MKKIQPIVPHYHQPSDASTELISKRENVRLILVGSRNGVTRIIHTLHRLGFAEATEWSPALPGRTRQEVMRILTRVIHSPH